MYYFFYLFAIFVSNCSNLRNFSKICHTVKLLFSIPLQKYCVCWLCRTAGKFWMGLLIKEGPKEVIPILHFSICNLKFSKFRKWSDFCPKTLFLCLIFHHLNQLPTIKSVFCSSLLLLLFGFLLFHPILQNLTWLVHIYC